MAIKKFRYPIPSGGTADAFATWSVGLSGGEIHQSLDYFTATIAGNLKQSSEREVVRPASPTHNVANATAGITRTLHLGTGHGTTAVVVLTMLNTSTQIAEGHLEVVVGGDGQFATELDSLIALNLFF